jgi:hypothetical protein
MLAMPAAVWTDRVMLISASTPPCHAASEASRLIETSGLER